MPVLVFQPEILIHPHSVEQEEIKRLKPCFEGIFAARRRLQETGLAVR
jgi:hypothetical protein